MIPLILIPWAALGLSLPVAKALGVADRIIRRKHEGRKSTLRDIRGDLRHMQAAESAAYQQAAKALCGGDRAPDVVVKAAAVAMKALTSYASPGVGDLLDGSPPQNPNKR